MKLKFMKLIRVPVTFQLFDGTERQGYRYMDIDGNIIAEAIKGEVYPSAVRELTQEMQAEAKREAEAHAAQEAEKAEAAKAEQEAQAEWDAMRTQMMKTASGMGVLKKRG